MMRLTENTWLDLANSQLLMKDARDPAKVHYVPLSPQELAILTYVGSRPRGEVVSAKQIVTHATKSVNAQGGGVPNLNVVISRIRKKVQRTDRNRTLLTTIWGRGYLLEEDELNHEAN